MKEERIMSDGEDYKNVTNLKLILIFRLQMRK